MFVNTGLVKMLSQQLSYMAGLYWRLYPANTTILSTTVLTDLGSEAAWSGYTQQIAGSYSAAIIVNPRSQSTQNTFITFDNSDISDQIFYVIALVDTSDSTLVWANNLGSTTIVAGGHYTFGAQVTDKEE